MPIKWIRLRDFPIINQIVPPFSIQAPNRRVIIDRITLYIIKYFYVP